MFNWIFVYSIIVSFPYHTISSKKLEETCLFCWPFFKTSKVGCQIFVKLKWMTLSSPLWSFRDQVQRLPQRFTLFSRFILFYDVHHTFLKFWNDQLFEMTNFLKLPTLVCAIIFFGFSWLLWILSIACLSPILSSLFN